MPLAQRPISVCQPAHSNVNMNILEPINTFFIISPLIIFFFQENIFFFLHILQIVVYAIFEVNCDNWKKTQRSLRGCWWGYRLHFFIKASHNWRPHLKSSCREQSLCCWSGCSQLKRNNSIVGSVWMFSSLSDNICVCNLTLNCTEWVCNSTSLRSTSANMAFTVAVTSSPLPVYDMTNSTCTRIRTHR